MNNYNKKFGIFARRDDTRSPTNGGPSCGGGWALRLGIVMTINLPDHLMSVTQCY